MQPKELISISHWYSHFPMESLNNFAYIIAGCPNNRALDCYNSYDFTKVWCGPMIEEQGNVVVGSKRSKSGTI